MNFEVLFILLIALIKFLTVIGTHFRSDLAAVKHTTTRQVANLSGLLTLEEDFSRWQNDSLARKKFETSVQLCMKT